MDIRTLRIFNTYGPRMRPDDGRVIPTPLTSAAGEDFTVYGEGTQIRRFCYGDDFVRGIHAVADFDPELASGEVVNLGNTEEIQVRELATLTNDYLETDSDIDFEELPEDDP